MIGVLTLFGETDLQPVLKKMFAQETIQFVDKNCNTSVQLMNQLDEHGEETDVVIVYGNAVQMDTFLELVDTIYQTDERIRIILILNGNPEQYLRSVLNEYVQRRIELVFDDNGFEVEELLNMIKKGKLPHHDINPQRRESGFQGDIEPEERNTVSRSRKTNVLQERKSTIPALRKETEEIKSFSEPQGHFVIGILNSTHGAGATTTAYHLARYFAMHGYKTCIADLSGTGALKLMKAKNVDLYTDDFDISALKEQYNITICDCGTPVEISADGQRFKLAGTNTPQKIPFFIGSDIKIIMGFSEPWNIEKIKFFFLNETWRKQLDHSYLFLLPQYAEKLKTLYPDYNIINRNEDFREMILEVFRKDEV